MDVLAPELHPATDAAAAAPTAADLQHYRPTDSDDCVMYENGRRKPAAKLAKTISVSQPASQAANL